MTSKTPSRFKQDSNAFIHFWEEEGNKWLLEHPFNRDLTQAQKYNPWYFECDYQADTVIKNHFMHQRFDIAIKEICSYLEFPTIPENTPDYLKSFLTPYFETPDWLDKELLAQGSNACQIAGKTGLIVLRNFSLMIGYQSAAINKPLIATGALHKGAVKRIGDTTDFWYEATGPSALEKGNYGLEYTLRIRLLHAYSRVMIKQKLDWHIEDQGEPLNQWDMVATYLGFSLVFKKGIERLGIELKPKESEGLYHLWKYIGHLIGIPHHLLPSSDSEAIPKLYFWSRTQPEVDTDSLALAKALHLEPLNAPFPKKKWEKKMIQEINLGFNRILIGEKSCELLQLPDSVFKKLNKSVIAINRFENFLCKQSSTYREYLIKRGRKEQGIIRNNVMSYDKIHARNPKS